MKKRQKLFLHPAMLILAGVVCGIVISYIFILPYRGKAAPYRPPPYSQSDYGGYSQGGYGSDDDDEPPPPTPTPCTPNLCVFEETSCCISPMCILLGQTSADAPGTNRCPEAGSQIHITNMHTWVQDFLANIYEQILGRK